MSPARSEMAGLCVAAGEIRVGGIAAGGAKLATLWVNALARSVPGADIL